MRRLYILVLILFLSMPAYSAEWSGNIALEWRGFAHAPVDDRQHDNNFSLSFQPQFYHEWNNGKQSFTFEPFFRLDEHDKERSHSDVRELNWLYVGDGWEIRTGISKVFWGVTESVHLVDIINQTDLVENIDGEDKLGQAMVKLTLDSDWGIIDTFMLLGSRQRTFPGVDGRLRTVLPVDDGLATFSSSRNRIDFAVRWSHVIGDWDIAVSHFSGMTREPLLRAVVNAGEAVLAPRYDVIDQTGFELQSTRDAWLWKLEVISRSGQGERFTAAAGGFEYTFFTVFDSNTDIGVLAEYLYDDRNEGDTIFENDLFVGMRVALNDVGSSELLGGFIQDLDSDSRIFRLEASRRYGDNWKLSIESRWLMDTPPDEILYGLRDDDFVQAELAYYF